MKVSESIGKKIFLWKGIDRHGITREGIVESINIDLARAQLERDGIKVRKVRKKPIEIIPTPIKSSDITLFSRQLATMTSAGVPIIRSLETIIESVYKNNTLKKLILNIKQSIEKGNTISDTLRLYPKYFDKLFCNLCEAGEESGTLDIMLDRIATHREAIQSIKNKVKKALTYPSMVFIVAIIVTWVLLNFAIPAFAQIFISSGTPLPTITRITIELSELTQRYWWMVLLLFLILVMAYKIAQKRYPKTRIWLDYSLLKLPIIGKIIQKSALARFARTLETTTVAGMPLMNALKAVAPATGNLKYEKATLFVREEVSKGRSMLHAASQTGTFPGLMLQMIAVGEESGHLEEMLGNLAKIYEDEVDMLLSHLSSALEPIMMIVLGCIVGFLVISMYVPMFSLGEAL